MSANKRRGSVRSGGSSTAMASASKNSVRAAEQDRPDVAAARMAWADDQPKLDPDRLVFIDETGTSTKMARLRGRAPRGERLVGKIRSLENHHLCCGPALHSSHCTMRHRWPDE